MRLSLLVPVAALAACGGEPEPKAKAPERPQAIEAGQWETSFEVTNFRRTDEGEPRLNMPVGTRGSGGACVGSEEVSRPPPAAFVPAEFTDCHWGDNFYMRSGRLVSGMVCRRAGVGEVEVTVNVDYSATGYEGTAEMLTRLPTDGDVLLAGRIEGRRTGECRAEGEAGNRAG